MIIESNTNKTKTKNEAILVMLRSFIWFDFVVMQYVVKVISIIVKIKNIIIPILYSNLYLIRRYTFPSKEVK